MPGIPTDGEPAILELWGRGRKEWIGEIVKVVPNVKKSTCLVHFADHAAAKTAKAKATKVQLEIDRLAVLLELGGA